MTDQIPDRPLFFGTRGPRDAKIVFVAESWGSEESRQQLPLVGESGKELDRMLTSAGVNPNEILFTNVVAAQPQGNEMWRFFEPRDQVGTRNRIRGLAPSPLVTSELSRLYQQIAFAPRSLIIAAGNWSLWAFWDKLKTSIQTESNNQKVPPELQTWTPEGIQTWRGSMLRARPLEGTESALADRIRRLKLLPIIHPAAILRQWSMREPTIQDLRARVPMALRDDWDAQERIIAPPILEECLARLDRYIQVLNSQPFWLACDIETLFRQLISCIGFADGPHSGMTIPLVRPIERAGETWIESYWSPEDELQITQRLLRILRHPNLLLIGQNFIYDTQHILHEYGVVPRLSHDTMLAQNVILPGTPKALWYLASLYCDYYWYWKDEGKEWNLRTDPLEQHLRYNCLDVMRTYEVAMAQRQVIAHRGLEKQMDLKLYTHHMCLRMMNRGVLIDSKHRSALLSDLNETTTKLKTTLLEIIPQEMVKERTKKSDAFWYSSDKQTKTLFYDLLGFRRVLHKKTKRPTTGKEALEKFRNWYPEFRPIIDRLDALGTLENSTQVISTPTEWDNRMRCSYNPGGTETHRLSSSENAFGRGTNLQNLTTGDEE